MDRIKLGEYVRFKDGEIGKIIDIKEDPPRVVYSEYGEIGLVADIVKHSPNIIDLIEVGDYVNGFEVDEFDDTEGNIYLGIPIYTDSLMNCIDEFRPINTIDIKSIVTKEQFANTEYKIKE